jgi:hypothetical protein
VATNIDSRVVAVGNPDDPASNFATAASPTPAGMFRRSTHSILRRTPVTRCRDELLPLLVSPEWVEERKLRWGVTSPIYQSKVLGEFPNVSDDTLIQPKWI